MKNSLKNDTIKVHKGCKDIWNAYMADGAIYSPHDIPFCPTTVAELPHRIVTWEEAKTIFKKNISVKSDFLYDAFVCFYIDDYKFDGKRGIWYDARHTLTILCHFAGVITPDFSTYQDFPEPLKIYATCRMRLMLEETVEKLIQKTPGSKKKAMAVGAYDQSTGKTVAAFAG